MIQMITPAGFPNLPYLSPGALASSPQRTLYISGQVGVDGSGVVGKDIGDQTRLAVANLNAVLDAAGMDGTNLAKVTIYLTDESSMPGFMEAAAGALAAPPPAMTLLIVKGLAGPSLLIEIEAIAVS
jgi:enamine deaminase RidA (YjgF/YER057c/UK114 family)